MLWQSDLSINVTAVSHGKRLKCIENNMSNMVVSLQRQRPSRIL